MPAGQDARPPLCGAPAGPWTGKDGGHLLRSATLRHELACVVLIVLTVGTFSNALLNGFVSFDDWFLIETNTRIRSLSPRNVLRMFTSKHEQSHAWLPLRELSYAIDYRLWGLTPVGYHLTNLLIHTANVLLVYAVLVWLVRAPVRGGPAPGWRRAPLLALLGAAAFAVHPVQVESVTWASGRRDVLYGLFFLLAFLSFLAYERRESGWRRWALYAASLACLGASLLSKASAMTLPAVLTLTVVVFGEEGGDFWRRVAATAPHWALTIVVTAVHVAVAREAGIVKGQAFDASLANVPLIFAKYWRLLFLPVHLSTPHGDMALRWSSDGPRIALLAAAAAGVAVAAWWAAPRRSLAVFCLGWWFLLLAPVANFVPLSVLVAERYLYLPLVGACAFGAELAGRLAAGRGRRVVVAACSVAIVALLAVGTHARNRVWANGRTFWRDSISRWPDMPVARIGLASEHLDANELEKAWAQYMTVALSWGRAASTHPDHESLVHVGLEQSYELLARQREAQGWTAGALEVYETVVRLMPKAVQPRVRLAQAYERMGQLEKAREQVMAVEKLDPDHEGLADWLKRLDAKQSERDAPD